MSRFVSILAGSDCHGYHGNLSTAGVAAGSYRLRVRLDSPTLVGDLFPGLDLS